MSQPAKHSPPPAPPSAPPATSPVKRKSVPQPAAGVKVLGPAAQPHPRPAGLPPNAIIIKTMPAPTAPPRQSSTTSDTAPQHSRSDSKAGHSNGSPPPAPPSVPANSWYAQPFTEAASNAMSTFHREHRGKVVFSPRAVPIDAADLQGLPDQAPRTLTVCTVGKDLLYGMAYLYSTPLIVEHQWRGRVGHLLRVRQQQEPIPDAVRRSLEGIANFLKRQQPTPQGEGVVPAANTKGPHSSSGTAVTDKAAAVTPSKSPAALMSPSSSANAGTNAPPVDYATTMKFLRGESGVYDRPSDDLLIGFRVYVNEELVGDHYPAVRALPQCTATIAANEAAFTWNCVPFVLMGYLNQSLLDPVTVFHSLSLNFVEHLLHVKLPIAAAAGGPRAAKAPAVELPLRVEVVYGCRAEAFYCTDFIARGRCVLRITEATKPSLKSYEEKLRTLVKARRGSPQLIPRSAKGVPPPRTCAGCGHPLQFCCTVCGAEVCGQPTCALRVVQGYPRACSQHLAAASAFGRGDKATTPSHPHS